MMLCTVDQLTEAGDACMRHPSKSSLVWIAINRLFGSNPLFIPKLFRVHSQI